MFLSADQFLGYDPSSAEWTVWVVKLPPGVLDRPDDVAGAGEWFENSHSRTPGE